MRPTSEVHTAMEICQGEIDRGNDEPQLSVAREVLAWVTGKHWADIANGPHPWLVGFLLDDPPKIDDTPNEVN